MGTSGPPGVNKEQMEWLSFIRYQLQVAQAQAAQPDPLNVLAISTLHDAVEAILGLGAEVLNANVKSKADFVNLLDAVVQELPEGTAIAGHRRAMISLNNARVAFKHHGNRIHGRVLDRHLVNGENFLRDFVLEMMGQDLDAISLLMFVGNEDVRDKLDAARGLWDNPMSRRDACHELWEAMDILIHDFEQSKVGHPGKSGFSTKPASVSRPNLRRGINELTGIHEWLENLDDWVRVLALGIDSRKYAYFRACMPVGRRAVSGKIYFQYSKDQGVSTEMFQRCWDFVLETALSFSQNDYQLDLRSSRVQKACSDPEGECE